MPADAKQLDCVRYAKLARKPNVYDNKKKNMRREKEHFIFNRCYFFFIPLIYSQPQQYTCMWSPMRFHRSIEYCGIHLDYLMHCMWCRRYRTHAHIDYSGFALAFNSNKYIIYTIYVQVYTMFAPLHVLNFGFFNTHTEYTQLLGTRCSFGASAYPFCHNWCCY